MYPKFTVKSIIPDESAVTGYLDRLDQGREHWIDDNYVGALLSGDVIAFGRWFKKDGYWLFRFDQEEAVKLSLFASDKISAIDGYWGERIEIVLDKNIQWSETEFQASELMGS